MVVLVVTTLLVLMSGLAVAAVTPPPQPLRERSIVLDHLSWLVRFATATFVVGAGAFIGITTQADFDARRGEAFDAQFQSIVRDCFSLLVPIVIAAVWVVGARVAWSLLRTSKFDRLRAAWLLTRLVGVQSGSWRNAATESIAVLAEPVALGVAVFMSAMLPAVMVAY